MKSEEAGDQGKRNRKASEESRQKEESKNEKQIMRIYAHTGARAFEMRPSGRNFKNGSGSKTQEKKNAHLLIEINFMICARPEAREKRASKKSIFEECAFTHLI